MTCNEAQRGIRAKGLTDETHAEAEAQFDASTIFFMEKKVMAKNILRNFYKTFYSEIVFILRQ